MLSFSLLFWQSGAKKNSSQIIFEKIWDFEESLFKGKKPNIFFLEIIIIKKLHSTCLFKRELKVKQIIFDSKAQFFNINLVESIIESKSLIKLFKEIMGNRGKLSRNLKEDLKNFKLKVQNYFSSVSLTVLE